MLINIFQLGLYHQLEKSSLQNWVILGSHGMMLMEWGPNISSCSYHSRVFLSSYLSNTAFFHVRDCMIFVIFLLVGSEVALKKILTTSFLCLLLNMFCWLNLGRILFFVDKKEKT